MLHDDLDGPPAGPTTQRLTGPARRTPTGRAPWTPSGPFLRKEGLAHGLTKHHLDGPAFHKLFGSVRVPVHAGLGALTRGTAALLAVPGAVVSHHTAAEIWDVVVPETTTTHVTVQKAAARRSRDGLRCHVHPHPALARRQGVLLTTAAQTFVDLAAHLDLVDLVVLGDSVVHRQLASPGELLDAAAAATGRHTAHARAAADLVRAGAQSPMETRSRLMLHLAGLPEPTLQHQVGRFFLDLAWPELRVAAEYDGRQHAEDDEQWGHDLGRREWLDGEEWRLVVLRATDVFDDPWAAVQRVVAAMAARGYEKRLGDPPADFARHFPGRPWRQQRRRR